MNNKQLILSTFMIFCVGLTGLKAQESLTGGGGEAEGSGGSVSFSVGQIFYTIHSTPVWTLTQGVQQPYEISVVTGVEEMEQISLSLSVYPNPATDYLTLKVNDLELKNLSFELYDLTGKLLQRRRLLATETKIYLNGYSSGSFILKIRDTMKGLKTFKILKW